MTTESDIEQPPRRIKFGPTFAACSTARTLIVVCGLVLFGTGSVIALGAGLTQDLPVLHPRMPELIEKTCVVGYIAALVLSFVGTIALFVHGLDRSGEVVLRGSRYRGMFLSKIALSIFSLPWIVLLIMIVDVRIY